MGAAAVEDVGSRRPVRTAAGRDVACTGPAHGPVVPERAPRVLGVDEFAFRKGWRYGTVLVDIEAARVVDVLPDRDGPPSPPGCTNIPARRSSAGTGPVPTPVPEIHGIAA